MKSSDLKLAKQALDEGRITPYEYEFYCKARKKKSRQVKLYVAIGLLMLFGILSIGGRVGDMLTGYSIADTDSEIVLVDLNVTQVLLNESGNGIWASGSGIGTIWADVSLNRYLVYNSTLTLVQTDKLSYAKNNTINVTVFKENYTLWLNTPNGNRVLVQETFNVSAPGNYSLDALFADSISTVEFEVREDNDSQNDIQRPPIQSFTNVCVETCDLQYTNATITWDGNITISNISLSPINENAPPTQLQQVPTINMNVQEIVTLDLNEYFADSDGDVLYFDTMSAGGIEYVVEGSVLTILAQDEGVKQGLIYATDLEELIQSNTFSIVVVNETIVQASNESVNTTIIVNTTKSNSSNNTIRQPLDNITLNESVPANCFESDPNKRPVECLQGELNYFADQEIFLENLDRKKVGRLTPIGNLLITGQVIEYSQASPGARDYSLGYSSLLGEFQPTIWLDSTTGDLHLRGSLLEANTNIALQEGWFGLTNKRGVLLMMANRQTGDVVLRGNVIPYRRALS